MYAGIRQVFVSPTALPQPLTCIANAEELSTLTNLQIAALYQAAAIYQPIYSNLLLKYVIQFQFYDKKRQASIQLFK